MRSGDVDEALCLVSTMDTIDAPIVGLVDGRCDVLGLAFLQTCDVRLATRFATFGIQRISSSTSFRHNGHNILEKYTEYSAHLELMQKKLDRVIVGKREGAELRSNRLMEFYENQNAFFGEDALRLGFIDEVVDGSGFWAGDSVLVPSKIGFNIT